METTQFWHATVATTGAGQALLEVDQAHISFLEKSGDPMEKYALALQRINTEQLQGADAARAHMLALVPLANSYLNLANTISGFLANSFKNQKQFAAAQAVINVAQAVTKTFAEFGGGPWGFAAAAAVAAAGAAQIAQIESAQPGSASSAKTPSLSAVASGAPAPIQQQAISINLVGDTFGRPQLENLVSQLKLYQKDGGTILLT
jgi:hypothetical protein